MPLSITQPGTDQATTVLLHSHPSIPNLRAKGAPTDCSTGSRQALTAYPQPPSVSFIKILSPNIIHTHPSREAD